MPETGGPEKKGKCSQKQQMFLFPDRQIISKIKPIAFMLSVFLQIEKDFSITHPHTEAKLYSKWLGSLWKAFKQST